MILWFALAGVAVSLAPESWVGVPGEARHWLAFGVGFAVQFGLMTLFLSAKCTWEAARLIPNPREAWFEDRGDHLAGTAVDGSEVRLVAEKILQIVETPGHLFLTSPGPVLILPSRVFRSAEEKHALAARWLAKIAELER